MTKHTPGPWRVVRANPSPTTGPLLIAGGKPGYIADVRVVHGNEENNANARLIAAAPQMFALLRAVRDAYIEDPSGRAQVIVQDEIEALIHRLQGGE
jgi:acetamidase/formamidase